MRIRVGTDGGWWVGRIQRFIITVTDCMQLRRFIIAAIKDEAGNDLNAYLLDGREP